MMFYMSLSKCEAVLLKTYASFNDLVFMLFFNNRRLESRRQGLTKKMYRSIDKSFEEYLEKKKTEPQAEFLSKTMKKSRFERRLRSSQATGSICCLVLRV